MRIKRTVFFEFYNLKCRRLPIVSIKLNTNYLKHYLKNNLIEIKIFGSKVRGSAGDESDLDIYILVKEIDYNIMHDISGFVAELNIDFNTNISPVIFSLEEDKKNRSFRSLFIKLLDKEGITVYGKKQEGPRRI